MIFPLRPYRYATPIPSLGGGTIRHKPVIPVTVIGPGGQEAPFALLDTGSDDIVFPAWLAGRIGVDLSGAAQRQAQGVGTVQPVALLYAPVILLLSDQIETCRWRAVVGFTHTPLRFPLLGIAGGLEHFRTTVDVADREILLFPKPSLPVTQDAVP